MNSFITVEDPTYVNQEARAARGNGANRFLKTYQSEKKRAVSFITGSTSLETLKSEPAATAAAEPETKTDDTEMKQ